MQLAGIACHFTGHSTRSASTSAAARAGVPLDTGSGGLVLLRDIQALLPEISRRGGVCKGSTQCFTRVTDPMEHVSKDMVSFSLGDPPFLCGPLVLFSVLLFA